MHSEPLIVVFQLSITPTLQYSITPGFSIFDIIQRPIIVQIFHLDAVLLAG